MRLAGTRLAGESTSQDPPYSQVRSTRLASCYGPDDEKGLRASDDRVGQRNVGWFVREVLLAREEPQERSALPRDVVANGSSQHRVAGLECVEDRSLRDSTYDMEPHFAVNAREGSQVRR